MRASVDSGREFWGGSSGKWAGEQLLRALNEGRELSTDELRTLGTLRKDEWKVYDDALIEEAEKRLVGVADLIQAGLTKNVPNALGTTVYEYEKIGDMEGALVSMDGNVQTNNDRVEFELAGIPLPIVHKDFQLNLRTLAASRKRGEALDTTQVRIAGRKIAEKVEELLFLGSNKQYGGMKLYGYTTHPDRIQINYGTGGPWAGTKTGDQILSDVLAFKTALHARGMYGPYFMYINGETDILLDDDFKAESDKTIRQRILEISGIQSIKVSDMLPDGELVMVQASSDVAAMVIGEPLRNIQWDTNGGFTVNFKGFTIMVPLIRSTINGNSGVLHVTPA